MSNLMKIKRCNNILLANTKVKQVAGGPTMTLVGFIHPEAKNLFKEINEDLSPNQIRHLAEKVCIVESQGIGFYPDMNNKDFYGKISYSSGEPEGWREPGTFHNEFNCLVNYYEENSKKFIYKIFSPLELEFV